jgi:hypothetical protein
MKYGCVPQIKAERLGMPAFLDRLQQEFADWQAQNETGSGWGFADVLALWRRKGYVMPDLDAYYFPPEKWEGC